MAPDVTFVDSTFNGSAHLLHIEGGVSFSEIEQLYLLLG